MGSFRSHRRRPAFRSSTGERPPPVLGSFTAEVTPRVTSLPTAAFFTPRQDFEGTGNGPLRLFFGMAYAPLRSITTDASLRTEVTEARRRSLRDDVRTGRGASARLASARFWPTMRA
jgi:hypothetical protein